MILSTSIEAMSIIRYYAARQKSLALDELKEGVVSCLQRLEELRHTLELEELRQYTLERQRLIFGALLDLAKVKKVPPSEILALFQESFEKRTLQEIISIEGVTRVFSTSEALRWKKLLNKKRD